MTPDGDDRDGPDDRDGSDGLPRPTAAQPQYFVGEPTVASDPVTIDVSLADTAFTLETDRGVFARGQLDAGTSLLLRTDVPLAPVGNLLDVGCGAGPIALAMARRSPDALVWAIDVNDRARSLCAGNAHRNRITNIRVCAPEEVPDDLRFETIWSNPPIRIGKQELHALLLRWLPRLAPSGSASLVVQKHLGADSLQRWLIDEGFPTERLTSKAGYRILHTSRL